MFSTVNYAHISELTSSLTDFYSARLAYMPNGLRVLLALFFHYSPVTRMNG